MKDEVKIIYESVLYPGTSWCKRRLSYQYKTNLKQYLEDYMERDGRNS